MKEIQKYFPRLPKGVIIAIAVIAVLVVCWFVFGKKLARNYINNKTKTEAENYTGTNTTQNLNFAGLRDRLISAVSGPGTRETEIYNVLSELNTQADWEYLQRYWQISLSKDNIGWGGLILSGMMGVDSTLIGTLKSELTKKELQQCRDILTANNIQPGF